MGNMDMSDAKGHVVWLDVVRFVAMFTVVCCHCSDPFNFYAGEPPANIGEIKFWGAAWGAFFTSLRTAFRDDNRCFVIAGKRGYLLVL